MDKKSKKAPLRYNVLLVPDDGRHVKSFHASADLLLFLAAFLILLFVASIGYTVYSSGRVDGYKAQNDRLNSELKTMSENMILLQADNEDLQNQLREANVTIESKDTAEKKKNEEESLKSIPSGLPLDGQIPVPSEYSDTNHYITFKASAGTKVVAAGDGVVTSVADSADYGHVVTIDHGNGYVTIYADSSDPTVNEKDEVIRGTTLFVMSSDSEVLTYEITYEGDYIDPYTVMDING